MPEPRYRLDDIQIAIIKHIAENPGRNRAEVVAAVSETTSDAPTKSSMNRILGEMLRLGCYDHQTGMTVPMILDRTLMRRGARHTYSLYVTEHGREAISERNRTKGVKVLSNPGQGNEHRTTTVDRVLSGSSKKKTFKW